MDISYHVFLLRERFTECYLLYWELLQICYSECEKLFKSYTVELPWTPASDNDEGADFFKQEKTRKVKISNVIDEHFAEVIVLEGSVKRNDMVQLKSK